MTERDARHWPVHFAVVLLLCAAVFISYIDRTNISVGAVAMQAELGWNETRKGLVLSSFFVGYILMMLTAARLANRYGGKIVLGMAVAWWSLFTVLTPPAAHASLPILVICRMALGLGEAAVFPASFNMIGRWVPPLQRSRAVALIASFQHLGTVFALTATGWLVQRYGWPMPFYVFGAIGFAWVVAWLTGISGGYGLEAASTSQIGIPWRRLLHSPAVWAIVVAHFCSNWSLYVLLAWLPSYFKSTFGVTLVNAGILSAAPWLVSFGMANVAGYVADRLLRSGRSASFVRKLMQTLGLGGAAIFLLQLPGATSVTTGAIIMCCATGSLAITFAGYAPNCFDVAPRHAEVVYGISNTFATLPGIVGVFVTGWLIDRTGSFAAPFVLASGVAALGALMYLVLGSGKQQVD
jgi:MFS transporter, ACS family, solute carrier family 17 (sodium-dependent inorganic phosphate cotransporter), other